jgi:hypothetical protein
VSYSWCTLAQARTALKGRLSDPSGIFWLDAELTLYIQESLRTFNSIAHFYKSKVDFPTQSGFRFYDLTKTSNPDTLTAGTGSGSTNPPALVGYSLTDRNLINLIQYHLMETVNDFSSSSTWAGTDQFTMDDLTRAIERTRNKFLYLTGLHITHSQVTYTPPANGKVSLSDSITNIRRVSFKDTSSTLYTPLWRSNELESALLYISWNTSAANLPQAYSIFLQTPIGIQIIPIYNGAGLLDLLTITNPTNLDESTGVLLNIPDDFAWIVKYGALADLLSKDGQAYDPTRAIYCQKRFEDGIKFALTYSLAQQVTISNSIVTPNSTDDFDSYIPNWENLPGTSTSIAIAGRNLVALYPVPNSVQTVELDVLANIPIPSASGDFLQIGREQFDSVLDYATHLAMFKKGMDEIQATLPLADNFMRQAMMHNELLRVEAKDYTIMRDYSKKEELEKPRFSKNKELQETM